VWFLKFLMAYQFTWWHAVWCKNFHTQHIMVLQITGFLRSLKSPWNSMVLEKSLNFQRAVYNISLLISQIIWSPQSVFLWVKQDHYDFRVWRPCQINNCCLKQQLQLNLNGIFLGKWVGLCKDRVVADWLFLSSNAQGKSLDICGMGELALKILMNGKKHTELVKPLTISTSVKYNTK